MCVEYGSEHVYVWLHLYTHISRKMVDIHISWLHNQELLSGSGVIWALLGVVALARRRHFLELSEWRCQRFQDISRATKVERCGST